MKKSELKNIIKECVKEVIFEEGVLSGIIAEVATGLQPALALQERQAPPTSQSRAPQSAQLAETKKKVLSAIGGDAYKEVKNRFPNPALFEGTVPIPSSGAKGGALKGVDPSDPGVDLSSIPGMSNWGTIAANIGRKG